ncbi:DUF899 family protein [Allohahella marinimesophila]|uniref:DUF899 domain-containing protein n=1 Tax=Allohahella marinimesophila TaxID=1054972 RepID=A0ABP7PBW6_9GAMM
MKESATPRIASRDEWEQARAELLVREKAHTKAGDELVAARRRLPMMRLEPVTVVGPEGSGDGGDLRCYLRVGDDVFQTYETKWRGVEAMMPRLQLLDLTVYGRQETWEDSPAGWPQQDEAGSWWQRNGRPVAQLTRTSKQEEQSCCSNS